MKKILILLFALMPLVMIAQSPSSGSYGACTDAPCVTNFSAEIENYCDQEIQLIVTTSTGTPVTVNAMTLTGESVTETVSGNTLPGGLPPGTYIITYSLIGGCTPGEIKVDIPICCFECGTDEFLASILANALYADREICIVDEFDLPYSGAVSNDGGLTTAPLNSGCATIALDGNNSITFYPTIEAENTCEEPETCQEICLTF